MTWAPRNLLNRCANIIVSLIFGNFVDLIGTDPGTKRYYVMMSLTDVLKCRISNVQLCFT